MLRKLKKKALKPASGKEDSSKAKKKPLKRAKPIRPVKVESAKKKQQKSKEKDTRSKESSEKEEKKAPEEEPKKEKKRRRVTRTVTDPQKDPAFQETLQQITQSSEQQKKHPEPATKQTETREASKVSVEEQQKDNDIKAHYESIEESSKVDEKKKFTAETFKQTLKSELDKLEKQLPHDSDSADDFKKEKPLEKLKDDVNSKVVDGKEKATGTLQKDAANDKPPQSNVAPVAPKPIPVEGMGTPPGLINGKSAAPKPKHASEISMEEESREIDDVMAQNSVTETQLANSNEPDFVAALDSKTEAQKAAANAPSRYRTKEKTILAEAKAGAEVSGVVNMGMMFNSRIGNFLLVGNKQTTTKDASIEKKQEINKAFETIYNNTKKKVTDKLDALTTYIEGFFEEDGAVYKAKKRFEKNVESELEEIYGWTTLDDKIFGEDTEAIERVFRIQKMFFITSLNQTFDEIAEHIATELNAAMQIIGDGRDESKKFYDGLSDKEKELAKDSYETFANCYNDLEETVSEKEKELAQSLANQYKKSVDSLRESFDKIKESVSASWIDKAIDAVKGVIDTIKKLGEMIRELVSEIADFIPKILDDPIGFVKMLFGGVKDGIELFKSNIKNHLIGGFIKWLTGAMGPMGITMPEDIFSLKGIFSLVMQILGLGWDFIRKKAVKLFGEPAVKVMEKSFEMFTIFRKEGIQGIWKYLKEKFNDLKQAVIEEIQTMLITQVIIAGVKWLVGLLVPGGAFIKAIIAIKDLIVTIVETAMMIIPVITNAIKALATGNVKGVAKAVENGLAALVVVIINIFAKILGLGGLAKKVQKIVKRVRKRIDRAVDKLLEKARKTFNKLFGRGKKGAKKDAKKEKLINKKIDKTLGKELKFTAGKESHKLWITNVGGKIKTMVASENPGPIEKRLQLWEKKLKNIANEKDKKNAQSYIQKAKVLNGDTLTEAKQESVLTTSITKDKMVTQSEYKKLEKSEKETIHKQVQLKKYMLLLFDIFGYDIDDTLTKFKSKTVKRHCAKEVESIINKNRANMSFHDKWDSFVTELKQFKLFEEMLKSGSEFYNFMQNGMDDGSLEDILIERRQSKFTLNDDKRAKIKMYLDNYMSEAQYATGKNEIVTFLKTLVDGQSSGEHTDYKPEITEVSIKNNVMQIKYKYKDNKTFIVTHNFNEIDKEGQEGVKQSTKGEKLVLKTSGSRGYTESAGSFVSQKSFYQSFINDFKDSDVSLNANLTDEGKLKAEINKIGQQKYAKYPKPNGETEETYHSFFDDISTKNGIGTIYGEKDDLDKLKKRVDQVGNRLYLNYTRTNKGPKVDPASVQDKKKKDQLERAGKYDKQNLFDSAHLLADWFGGSGYRKALNLNVTSAEYNRITMGDEEKDIEKEVIAKKKNNDDVIFFNLTVESRWDTLDDKAVLAKITQSEIYKDISKKDKEADKGLATKAAEKLSSLLLSKEDPKRVLGVKYKEFEMHDAANESLAPKKREREIGCDIWMSSYFKFDEKSKHKCNY